MKAAHRQLTVYPEELWHTVACCDSHCRDEYIAPGPSTAIDRKCPDQEHAGRFLAGS